MAESLRRRSRASKPIKEQLFLKAKLTPFGRACFGVWPDNASKELADRAHISVRNANQIMRGDRRLTTGAMFALFSEFAKPARGGSARG